MKRFFLIATTLLLAGCPVEPEVEWVEETQSNEGTACLTGEADGAGTITVNADVCLSSSCSRAAEGSCTATVDGTTITVTSEFSWEEATGDVACTDDCGSLSTTCTTDALPAGDYTVVHGSSSETISIPNSDPCGS